MTPEQLIKALAALDVEGTPVHQEHAVNVWRPGNNRVPWTTVWLWRGGVKWGDNYQHHAPYSTRPEVLAKLVLASMGDAEDG